MKSITPACTRPPGTNIGNVATLDDAGAAFNPTERISGQTITAFVRE